MDHETLAQAKKYTDEKVSAIPGGGSGGGSGKPFYILDAYETVTLDEVIANQEPIMGMLYKIFDDPIDVSLILGITVIENGEEKHVDVRKTEIQSVPDNDYLYMINCAIGGGNANPFIYLVLKDMELSPGMELSRGTYAMNKDISEIRFGKRPHYALSTNYIFLHDPTGKKLAVYPAAGDVTTTEPSNM